MVATLELYYPNSRLTCEHPLQTIINKTIFSDRWMKQYEDEHDHLRLEVDNVKEILDQLPEGCFKRIVLEPTEGPSRAASFR